MLKSELGTENDEQATEKIMRELPGGDILFAHHSISDTTFNGLSTNTLKEVVYQKLIWKRNISKLSPGTYMRPSVWEHDLNRFCF